METTEEVEVARNLGLGDITFFAQVGLRRRRRLRRGRHTAAMAVATGQANVAVAWRSRKRASGSRPWASRSGASAGASCSGRGRSACCGPVDEIAMLARRYMHEFGAHPRAPRRNVALTVPQVTPTATRPR